MSRTINHFQRMLKTGHVVGELLISMAGGHLNPYDHTKTTKTHVH